MGPLLAAIAIVLLLFFVLIAAVTLLGSNARTTFQPIVRSCEYLGEFDPGHIWNCEGPSGEPVTIRTDDRVNPAG